LRIIDIPACAIKDTNQRSPAEHGSGPFEGLSSYLQLCWWSLICRVLGPGSYQVVYLPLTLAGGDGAPARAMLIKG